MTNKATQQPETKQNKDVYKRQPFMGFVCVFCVEKASIVLLTAILSSMMTATNKLC